MPCAHVIFVTCDFGDAVLSTPVRAAARKPVSSGIGCAELPYSGSTPESGARCCCILCCPYHHCQTRRAASSMPLAQWAVHSPRAGGGHRAISLKKMSRSDTMPMFPNCYVGTGRALCAQCGISVNPHIRCPCTACGVRHLLRHCIIMAVCSMSTRPILSSLL